MDQQQHAQGGMMDQQQQHAQGGSDPISKMLDKLERKFGGERFNNPNNEAKNRAMNQKLSKRLKQVAKMAMRKLPGMMSKYR